MAWDFWDALSLAAFVAAGLKRAARRADEEKAAYLKSAAELDRAGQHKFGTEDIRCALACKRTAEGIRSLKTEAKDGR